MPENSPVQRLIARFMRAFFARLYHSLAWSYDLVAAVVSLGNWGDWVSSVLPALGGGRVLELGHGPGYLQGALARRGLPAFGVDESSQMGRLAARRLRQARLPIRLARGLAQQLPFPAGAFERVAATFPSEYLFDPATLAEAQRVLKPGGALWVVVGAQHTGNQPWQRALRALFRLTGQEPAAGDSLLAPFARAGFQAQIEAIPRKASQVWLIEARKPPGDS